MRLLRLRNKPLEILGTGVKGTREGEAEPETGFRGRYSSLRRAIGVVELVRPQ
jgi:hypothetical protein